MCSVNEPFDEQMSGRVFPVNDTQNVVQRLANHMSGKWQRSCTIGIANRSEEVFINPLWYLNSGQILRVPLRIEPGFVGLIATHKSSHVARGTVGVLTYELAKIPTRRLQLMWSVPFDFNLYESWTNADVSWLNASKKLYEELYYGKNPAPIKATETPHACPSEMFNIRVFMSNNSCATLILSFKGLYDDDDDEDSVMNEMDNFVY